MAMEEWRDVIGYEGLYQVSGLGRLRGRLGVMRPRIQWTGYDRAALSKNGVRKDVAVHRLVARAFIGPRPDGYDVNHKNGVRADNRAENLEYLTRRENIHHQKVLGTFPEMENNPNAKLKREQVLEIRSRRADGERADTLAAEYGVSKPLIHKIAARECWPNI